MSKLENQTIYECDICHTLALASIECSDTHTFLKSIPSGWNKWRNLDVCPKCSKAVGVAIIMLIGKEKAD